MVHIEESPKLAGYLKRYFAPEEQNELALAFRVAMNNGATKEIDFGRKDGTSYNPRPARVFSIMYSDASVKTPTTLAASMLALVEDGEIIASFAQTDGLSADTLETALKTLECQKAFTTSSPLPDSHEALVITSAIWLDRARHLHLAQPQHLRDIRQSFIETTNTIIMEIETACPALHSRLLNWKNMFLRRQDEQ
jgi:hypothetical protein